MSANDKRKSANSNTKNPNLSQSNKHKRRKKPSPFVRDLIKIRNKLLNFFFAIKNQIALIVQGEERATARTSLNFNDKYKKPLIIGVISVLLLIIIYFIYWNFTNINAIEVFLNEKSVGYTKNLKDIDDAYLKKHVFTKVEQSLEGTKITSTDIISTKAVHANKVEVVDEIVNKISKDLSYLVEACSINVDDMEIAIVKNETQAKAIEAALFEKHKVADKKIVKIEFIEKWFLASKYVKKDEIITNDKAIELLTKTFEKEVEYIIKSGDSLGKVSAANDISLEKIYALNSDITKDTILKIGQAIKLSVNKPLLSVRTYEEIEYIEVAKKNVKKQLNPEQKKSYSKVIVQGSDGQQKIIAHIVRENTLEVDKLIISTTVVKGKEPVDEIIEVGTK